MNIEIDYNELDPGVRNMVRYFNEKGLATRLSCEGHPGTDMRLFWIEFTSNVTENDIRDFMEEHTEHYTSFTANGWFCRRFEQYRSPSYVKEESSLCYVASDQASAADDLRKWIRQDQLKEKGEQNNE